MVRSFPVALHGVTSEIGPEERSPPPQAVR
jgi:hypothetical protein